jgi:hypothetical protein
MMAPPGDCNISGTTGACHADSACTAGAEGRCIETTGGAVTCVCTYDQCASDASCATGQTCACHGSPYTHGQGNTCVQGNCRVDSDCGPGGYCSPADNSSSCGSLLGYYCHTPGDQCIDDSDCKSSLQVCTYVASAGNWECKQQGLCAQR